MNVTQIQYHIDRCDVEALTRFLSKRGMREEQGHIFIARGRRLSTAEQRAVDYLVNEFDYSSGPQPETIRVDHT